MHNGLPQQPSLPWEQHFTAAKLASPISSDDRFSTIDLKQKKGRAIFRIGKISREITFTHSHCLVHQDYHSCIDYDEQTSLLIFGLSGHSQFKVSLIDQSFTVRGGDVWYVRVDKGSLFRTTAAGQENEMAVVKYTGHRLGDALGYDDDSTLSSAVCVNRVGHQASAEFGIADLLHNPLTSASDRLLAEGRALQLLAHWIAPGRQALTAVPEHCKQCLSAAEQAIATQVIKALANDLTHTPSLQQLAEQLNISHTKLNRCFKKAHGTTVYHWLRNFRLEQARSYLANSDSTITRVAFHCGFSSASHFALAFKQQYHCSPAEYRRDIIQQR